MKKTFILSSLIISFLSFKAQYNQGLWRTISEKEIPVTGKRDIVPEKFKTFHVDINSLKNILASAPLDKNVSADNSSIIINLPMPDGAIQSFKVVESPVMEDALQNSFPSIRTYNVRGIDDAYASGKLDLTEFGFHGMIRSSKGDIFIDPYCKWNNDDYISYYTTDFVKPLNEIGTCEGVLGSIFDPADNFAKTAAQTAFCA